MVIDPQRDVDQYIDEAEAQGFKIKHVIETHLHADFVSGHRELSRMKAAVLYHDTERKKHETADESSNPSLETEGQSETAGDESAR